MHSTPVLEAQLVKGPGASCKGGEGMRLTIGRRYLQRCHVSNNVTAPAAGGLTEIPRLELFCERHICALIDAAAGW